MKDGWMDIRLLAWLGLAAGEWGMCVIIQIK